jgi:dimethylaniline monooxygenase (N-oxide forming)
MAFSDYPPEGHRHYWHHTEYIEYLLEYSAKFSLGDFIAFDTEVINIEKIDREYQVITCNVKTREVHRVNFDAIVLCTGTHQVKNVPEIPGLQTFDGNIIHSSEYKSNDGFKAKNVVCVGIGESSADIVREVAEVAQNCTLAIRSYPKLVPRIVNTSSSDGWTTRILHANTHPSEGVFAYLIGGGLTYLRQLKKSLWDLIGLSTKPALDAFHQPTEPKMLDLDTEYDDETLKLIKTWFYLSGIGKFLTKNTTFVPNILNGKITVVRSEIERIDNSTVFFADGRSVSADTIIFCTGYMDDFEFLGALKPKDGNVRNLFMQAFHPDYPDCAFIGWARPTTGGIPACSEMAARYFSLLLSGKVKFPDNIEERIEEDKAYYKSVLSRSYYINSLVLWKRHMETLAKLIGCQLSLWKYVFQPRLFYKLLYGSLIPVQYRLRGPHSNYRTAKRTILNLPVTLPHTMCVSRTRDVLLVKVGLQEYITEGHFIKYEYFPEGVITDEDIDRYRFDNVVPELQ